MYRTFDRLCDDTRGQERRNFGVVRTVGRKGQDSVAVRRSEAHLHEFKLRDGHRGRRQVFPVRLRPDGRRIEYVAGIGHEWS